MAKKDILDLIKNKDLTLKEKISRLPQGWTRDFTMNELLTEIPREYKKAYIDINNAYWKDRNIINYINGEKNALRASNSLEKVYKESVQNIEDKIDVFYGRYANKEGITLDEAKKLLNKQELGKFKDNLDKLIKSSKQDGLTEAEQKELRLLKARTNISKLDDLKTQIKYELEKLTGKNQVTIEDLLRNSYKDTYHKTIYDTDYTSSFNILSKDRVEKAAKTKYMSSNYSSRLYEGKQKLLTKVLEQDIPRGLALGYNPRKLAREVEKSLGTNFNACVRLIRTENNRITNEATLDALKQEGERYYKIDVTLDSRTSDICRLIAAEDDVYEVSKAEIGITAPPFHPNCRSLVVKYIPDDEFTNMTYEQMEEYYANQPSFEDWLKGLEKQANDKMQYKQSLQDETQNDTLGWGKEPRKEIKIDNLHPETLLGVKLGKEMTFEEADGKKVNPGYDINKNCKTNCQSAVIAFEARLRGYNTISLPRKHGGNQDVIAVDGTKAWFKPRTKEYPLRTNILESNRQKIYQTVLDEIKENERYTISFAWKGRSSGHILSMIREKDKIKIYDPQNAKIYTDNDVHKLFESRVRTSKPIKILRIDNLEFNEELLEGVISSK